jgi:hypothetical protein
MGTVYADTPHSKKTQPVENTERTLFVLALTLML